MFFVILILLFLALDYKVACNFIILASDFPGLRPAINMLRYLDEIHNTRAVSGFPRALTIFFKYLLVFMVWTFAHLKFIVKNFFPKIKEKSS